MRIEYSSNNSGGEWWLSDKDWQALEDAGWEVIWGGYYFCNDPYGSLHKRHPDKIEPCAKEKDCPGHRGFDSLADVVAYDARWIGAAATYAVKDFPSVEVAKEEWERIVRQDAEEEGCRCCGQPHYFREDSI